MGKIVVGCWDCDYCKADRISGDIKICPKCGKPRGKDIRFYMAGPKNYVEDPDKVNKNPDWLCPYCNTLNPDDNKFCSACGAAREESELNYFESKEKEEKKKEEREAVKREEEAKSGNGTKRSGGSILPFLLGIAAVIALFVFLTMPKTKGMHVDSKLWERSIQVERYQEVQESSWSLPDQAMNVSSRDEVYTYNHVLDHYEIGEREVAEQVLDGYDTEIEYRDLGNGMFEEVEYQIPRYRTEYRTETYEYPVYVDVPVFAKKYYYTIMRWRYDRDETTSGADNEPYFADLNLPDTERECGRWEQYWIVSGDKKYAVKYELWDQIKTGSDIKATTQSNEILELK